MLRNFWFVGIFVIIILFSSNLPGQPVVKASSFGFDRQDATKCLTDAIASGAKTLLVDNTGSDWVVSSTISLPSDFELRFEDGVVLRARRGFFKPRSSSLLEVRKQKNVRIIGEGKVVLMMNKSDYMVEADYVPSHHRHTLNIFNCDNVAVENLTLLSSGGDGVYVGTNNCFNISLDRIITDDHLRDGLSVTGVYNLKVTNSSFSGGPQAGCDVEQHYPGGHGRSLEKIVFENCSFANNQGFGVTIKNTGHGNNDPIDLIFRNCQFYQNKRWGIYCQGLINPKEPRGRILFENCQVFGNQEHQIGWVAFSENVDVYFKNCFIDASQGPKNPVWLTGGTPEDLCNIFFSDCRIQDRAGRKPIQFTSRFGNGIVNSKFGLTLISPDGTAVPFQEQEFLAASAPNEAVRTFKVEALPSGLKPMASQGVSAGGQLQFRGKFTYLAYAEIGQELKIRFRSTGINLNAENQRRLTKVQIIGPTFDSGKSFTITPGDTVDFSEKITETGVYTFMIDTFTHVISIESSAAGQGVAANERLYLLNCSGKLYFLVHAGCPVVRIEAEDYQNETAEVRLLDASGQERDIKNREQRVKILTAERSDASAQEIWSIDFKAAKLWVRIGSPLLPVFSTAPDNLLQQK